jgi:hypothetical protein
MLADPENDPFACTGPMSLEGQPLNWPPTLQKDQSQPLVIYFYCEVDDKAPRKSNQITTRL